MTYHSTQWALVRFFVALPTLSASYNLLIGHEFLLPDRMKQKTFLEATFSYLDTERGVVLRVNEVKYTLVVHRGGKGSKENKLWLRREYECYTMRHPDSNLD